MRLSHGFSKKQACLKGKQYPERMNGTRTVWRLITHHAKPNAVVAEYRDGKRVAIGWNSVGDVRNYASPESISRVVKDTRNPNWRVAGIQLWNFCHSIELHDLVILSDGDARRVVMEVVGGYGHVEGLDDDMEYGHQRDAVPTNMNADALWKEAGELEIGQNIRWSLVRCPWKVGSDGKRLPSQES
jgi:hypothetical protein